MNEIYTITFSDPQGKPCQYGNYPTFMQAATVAQTLQTVADDRGCPTRFAVARQTDGTLETVFKAMSLSD
jgi:hypothetical protein